MKMLLSTATLGWDGWKACFGTWIKHATEKPVMTFVGGLELVNAYRKIHECAANCGDEIIGYVHDDVVCYEDGWDRRIARQFDDEKVAVVGCGGALGHGSPALYQGQYHLPNLARQYFMSNMRSAEAHGARFNGECEVAVLDGFALFVRASFLTEIGGWPKGGRPGYFMYSEWLCCMAHRHGYKVRLVGVDCEHLGGKSTGLKPDQVFDFEGEHRWLYDNFSDVLPYSVEGK